MRHEEGTHPTGGPTPLMCELAGRQDHLAAEVVELTRRMTEPGGIECMRLIDAEVAELHRRIMLEDVRRQVELILTSPSGD